MAASVFSDEDIWGRDSDCGGGEQDHHEDKIKMPAADDEDEEYQRGYEDAIYDAQEAWWGENESWYDEHGRVWQPDTEEHSDDDGIYAAVGEPCDEERDRAGKQKCWQWADKKRCSYGVSCKFGHNAHIECHHCGWVSSKSALCDGGTKFSSSLASGSGQLGG